MNRPLTFLRGRVVCVFVVLIFLTSGNLFAQSTIGRQLVDQYATSPWNTSTYGLTWLPTDYASNPTKKYPLIIFLHGSGEGGDGVGGLYTLASQGLPMTIANGWNPEAVNPADGQNYKFIVVSPQAPWSYHWSYGFPALQYIIPDVLSRYRVDLSRVYVTGLSAGGSGTYSCVTNGQSFAQKIAAVVPVCPAGANTPQEFDQLPMVGGTYGVKVWSPVGATDALLSWAQTAVTNINSGSPSPSTPAVVSAIPGVGHEPAGWNMAYNPSWRSNSQNLNIYEWMLKSTRNGNGNINTNLPPVSNAGTDQTITLPVSSVQLNGSGSDPDGTISTYSWTQVSGPSSAVFSNTGIANPSVNNLIAGSYTLRLKVTDNSGTSTNDDVVINVNPAPASVSYTSVPGRIQAEGYSGMFGIQTENSSDAGGGQNVAWQDDNDWMNYNVNVTATGVYTVNFRVATQFSGAQFQLRKADGTTLTTINVPNTGGFQNWQSVSATVNLSAGQQSLRIYTTYANGGWNFNWFEFAQTAAANQLPTVSAGSTQTVALPASSATLTGTASDADGWIASYFWSQVSGPSTASISNSGSASTGVRLTCTG
jgi:predicted esterase